MSAPKGLVKISPSDLTYQFKDCKRCFWLKVVKGISKPWSPMPGIFNKIDGAMKGFFNGMSTEKLGKMVDVTIPEGTVRQGKEDVKSAEIVAHGRKTGMMISGKVDSRIMFKDGTFGIVDFKTSALNPSKAEIYAPQLRAYSYCMEHPMAGKGLTVSLLALLGFDPGKFGVAKDGSFGLNGTGSWFSIDLGREEFENLMSEVAQLVASTEPPFGKCGLCDYRAKARTLDC